MKDTLITDENKPKFSFKRFFFQLYLFYLSF